MLIKSGHRLPALQEAEIGGDFTHQNAVQLVEQPLPGTPALPVGFYTDRANTSNQHVLPVHAHHPPPKAELRHWQPSIGQPQMILRLTAPVRYARPELGELRIGTLQKTAQLLFQFRADIVSGCQPDLQQCRSGPGMRVFASP